MRRIVRIHGNGCFVFCLPPPLEIRISYVQAVLIDLDVRAQVLRAAIIANWKVAFRSHIMRCNVLRIEFEVDYPREKSFLELGKIGITRGRCPDPTRASA